GFTPWASPVGRPWHPHPRPHAAGRAVGMYGPARRFPSPLPDDSLIRLCIVQVAHVGVRPERLLDGAPVERGVAHGEHGRRRGGLLLGDAARPFDLLHAESIAQPAEDFFNRHPTALRQLDGLCVGVCHVCCFAPYLVTGNNPLDYSDPASLSPNSGGLLCSITRYVAPWKAMKSRMAAATSATSVSSGSTPGSRCRCS